MPTSTAVKVEGAVVRIEGIDTYRVLEPLFECVRVVLSHRGEEYSADYIQGISGAAFRIAGICPCAPTCSFAMKTQDLPKLLGYDVEMLVCKGGGWERGETNPAGRLAKMAKKGVLPAEEDILDPDVRALRRRLQDLIDRTKEEVRRGRPVVFWNAFTTAEFDVVCGYDDEKKVFLGRGSYAGKGNGYAVAPETKSIMTALVGGCPTAILIGQKVREFDARAAELAALREAVKHGRSKQNCDETDPDKWRMLDGIACYDRWAREFAEPDHKRGPGDSYCYNIVRSTHRSAAGFLREIAPRYPQAKEQLLAAADRFEKEAGVLDSADKLLGWGPPREPDAARNRRVADILAQARDHYTAGIEQIERALDSIDARAGG